MDVDTWKLREGKKKAASSEKDREKIESICDKFRVSMDDDFNTPRALASMFDLVDLGARLISADKQEAFELVREKLKAFFKVLGLREPAPQNIPPDAEKKRTERDKARRNKDFKEADQLRDELKNCYNLAVNDTGAASTLHWYSEREET